MTRKTAQLLAVGMMLRAGNDRLLAQHSRRRRRRNVPCGRWSRSAPSLELSHVSDRREGSGDRRRFAGWLTGSAK
jgi:hypothetical protein